MLLPVAVAVVRNVEASSKSKGLLSRQVKKNLHRHRCFPSIIAGGCTSYYPNNYHRNHCFALLSSSSTTMSSSSSSSKLLAGQSISNFCIALASKQPTPGGGASAAISGGIGAATASMSAAYTQRKKDEESGSADRARKLIQLMDIETLLKMADDDEKAYKDLQSTWKKDCTLSQEEISTIQLYALQVPTTLLEETHKRILAIKEFLPYCNPNITSDAKVGIHQLAGAARSAYQTVLVNTPPTEEKDRLKQLLLDIQQIENDLLEL